MPVTALQRQIANLLAVNRSPDSHLAGGAALHFQPNTRRYSNDLDYFHDSVERVATAFAVDAQTLERHGFTTQLEIKQPGYIRATVKKDVQTTKIEWAHDSDWRFLPAVKDREVGYVLHSIDLAINKLLALAGRDEARDFLDVIDVSAQILPLGALCWAAPSKDPGFTAASLLDLIKRRGKYRVDDFRRLHLSAPVDLRALKQDWLTMLENAEIYIAGCDICEPDCLYYSSEAQTFVRYDREQRERGEIQPHFARPGGILPQFVDRDR